ncbi:hypothetical protein DVH24_011190 [Malus domestica]|uniref:Berberine/berberine-like domain-containing protein n=1 Tax=Malus domestica TaxID=3750 RepID=A0A498JUL0_MALDO|nr:hypothetical protein DVH24_011190 [Malus domestica]
MKALENAILLCAAFPIFSLISVSCTNSSSVEYNFLQCLSNHSHSSNPISEALFTPKNNDLFIRAVPKPVNRTIEVSFVSLFLGNSDRLLKLMNQSFPQLGLEKKDCIEMSWIQSVLFWADYRNGTTPPDVLLNRVPSSGKVFLKRKSDYVKEPISKTDLEALWKVMIEIGEVMMLWNPYGGKMNFMETPATSAVLPLGFFLLLHVSMAASDPNPTQDTFLQCLSKFSQDSSPPISAVTVVVMPVNKKVHQTVKAKFVALFLGNAERLHALMDESLPQLGLKDEDYTEMSWIESVLYWSNYAIGTPADVLLERQEKSKKFLKKKSDYVQEPMSKAGLEGLWNKMMELKKPVLTFNPYGGKMSEISELETPFPHRAGNVYKIQYSVNWKEEGVEAADRNIDLIRRLYEFMTPYVSKSPRCSYLNYRDVDLGTNGKGNASYSEARVWGRKYFNGNFDRLVQVKTAVDPGNFFTYEQSIPSLTAWEASASWAASDSEVAPTTDDGLFLRLLLQPVSSKVKKGEKTIRASVLAEFLGNADQLVKLLGEEFPELGLKKENCTEMSWIESVLWWANFDIGTSPKALLDRMPNDANFLKRKSDYVQTPISKDGLEWLWKKMIELGKTGLVFNPYGGEMSRIAPSETPFPHRAGNLYKIQYSVNWEDAGEDLEKNYTTQSKRLFSYMTPFVSKNPRSAFLNYRDLDIGATSTGAPTYEEGKVYGVKYFNDNFDRLVKVKTAVDPENFFYNEQSIPILPRKESESIGICSTTSNSISESFYFLRLVIQAANGTGTNGGKTIQVMFNFVAFETVEKLLPWMQENFPELNLDQSTFTEMSWIESALYVANLPINESQVLLQRTQQSRVFFKNKSDFVTEPISEVALEGLWKAMLELDSLQLMLTPYGGRMSEIYDWEIPFPHRKGNLFEIQYVDNWVDDKETEEHIRGVRSVYEYMTPYVSKSPRAAYLNYRDLDLGRNKDANTSYAEASAWGLKYFKNNFRRLVQIKTSVDPDNFFRDEQSIPVLQSAKK